MKVGAKRDRTLDLFAAVSPSGETGTMLRIQTRDEKFLCFLGEAEVKHLRDLLATIAANPDIERQSWA